MPVKRAAAVVVLGLSLMTTNGCAPLAQRWADRGTERAIAEAADDDSFPSASEAGLASFEPPKAP